MNFSHVPCQPIYENYYIYDERDGIERLLRLPLRTNSKGRDALGWGYEERR